MNTTTKELTIQCDGLFQETYTVPADQYRGLLFGLELELFTVDSDLVPQEMDLAGLDSHFIKPEFALEQIELNTDPFSSLLDVRAQLYDTAQRALAAATEQKLLLLPISLFDEHPLRIRTTPRYRLLSQHLGRPFTENAPYVASGQVNVGADNEQQAFEIFNALRHLLPLLLALSAASPFSHGQNSGSAAKRMDTYDAAIGKYPELTGLPPIMHDLGDYAVALETLPVFQHPNMYYKHMRPMPQRGVAGEIRCPEVQHTIDRQIALAALTKGYVLAYLSGEISLPAESSLEPSFAIARTYGDMSSRNNIDELLEIARAHLPLQERVLLDPLQDHCPAKSMIANYSRGKSVTEIYKEIAHTFATNLRAG